MTAVAVALAGLGGVLITALLTFVTSRRTAKSSELAVVVEESRAMRVELRAEAASLRAEASMLRVEAERTRVRLGELEAGWAKCRETEERLHRQLVDAGVIP